MVSFVCLQIKGFTLFNYFFMFIINKISLG